MSLFTKIPVSTNDATLPQLSSADINWLSGLEENAYEHWIFDNGDSASLTGKVNNVDLTLQGAAPTYNNKSLVVNTSEGNALLSGVTDSDMVGLDGFTMFAAIKTPPASSGNPSPIFGNYRDSPSGLMLDIALASGVGWNLYLRGNGIATPGSYPQLDFNTWYFVCASGDLVNNRSRVYVTEAKNYDISGFSPSLINTQIGLGNADYANAPSRLLEIGEFGIIKKPYTTTEMAKLYENSKKRMANRGIVLA